MAVVAGALLMVVGGWCYQACAVYDSSLLLPLDAGASASETGVDASACLHVGPPLRPDAGDVDGGIEVIAAFKTIDIGLTTDASAPIPPYGYDLDNVCTCPGASSCVQAKGAPVACDDDAGGNTGIDNTAISLFRGLGVAAATGTNQIDVGLQSGQFGLLLVIDQYNGQPNDPNVSVSYYVSNGVNRTSDGGIPKPDFLGEDRWTIDPGSLLANTPLDIASCENNAQCQPAFSDDRAYVSNNFVVAHFNQIPVAFGDRSFLGGATMVLDNAIIVGELRPVSVQPVGFSYELTSGTIAGRWSTQSLLSTLATIPDTAVDGGFLCGISFNYNLIKVVACQAADISENPSNDNTSAACDAVSVGMTFTAGPAQLGAVLKVPAAPAGCASGGVPFTDNCP